MNYYGHSSYISVITHNTLLNPPDADRTKRMASLNPPCPTRFKARLKRGADVLANHVAEAYKKAKQAVGRPALQDVFEEQDCTYINEEGVKLMVRAAFTNVSSRHVSSNSLCNQFEAKLAQVFGYKQGHVVACNSGTTAIELAFKGLGFSKGDKIIVPAFTFIAVPSVVANIECVPVLANCDSSLTISLNSVKETVARHPDAKFLLMSYMRGRVPHDLESIVEFCRAEGIKVVDDAAHAIGVLYDGEPLNLGDALATSFQVHKTVQTGGEGGAVMFKDARAVAKAAVISGCYDLTYKFHGFAPKVVEAIKQLQANGSQAITNYRLNEFQAAAGLGCLADFEERIAQYNRNVEALESYLCALQEITLPERSPKVRYVKDSIQFSIDSCEVDVDKFLDYARAHHLPMKVCGPNNARNPMNWIKFVSPREVEAVRETVAILANTVDLRIPQPIDAIHVQEITSIIRAGLDHCRHSLHAGLPQAFQPREEPAYHMRSEPCAVNE